MADAPVLEIINLSKRFLLHERAKIIEACSNLSVRVQPGEMTALVGASGSGKSSVLNCVYRTYLPTSGQVLYRTTGGEIVDLASASETTILQLRRREIRFVSQFLHALPRQVAVDVVARPLVEIGDGINEARRAARSILERVGLPRNLWDVPPHTFSGGERQLVNLARALIVRPRLLLLDEPTASLDPTSTEQILCVVAELKEDRMGMLAVFHNRQIVQRLADRTHEMHGGVHWAVNGTGNARS